MKKNVMKLWLHRKRVSYFWMISHLYYFVFSFLNSAIFFLDNYLLTESCDVLHFFSLSFFSSLTEFTRICLSWKTETWLWLRIFLTDMIIYQVKKNQVKANKNVIMLLFLLWIAVLNSWYDCFKWLLILSFKMRPFGGWNHTILIAE